MLLQKYITVCPTGKAIKRYKKLGYNPINKQPLEIKVEDVERYSSAKEKRKCDSCGKIEERSHRSWEDTKNTYGKDYCLDCSKKERMKRVVKTNRERLGVDYPQQSNDVKKKTVQSYLRKYGVENPQQCPETKEKTKKTCLERYGVENSFSSPEIIKKIKETNLRKYGVENPQQCLAIKEKTLKTLEQNGTVPTSKQQLKIFDMCKELFPQNEIQLNYFLDCYFLDIVFFENNSQKINIEYDGWYWHEKNQEKDKKRDEYILSNGFKILRIKSGSLLPTKEQIVNAIKELLTTDKNFEEIILPD